MSLRFPTSTTLHHSACNSRPLLLPCTCPHRSLRMPLPRPPPSYSRLSTHMPTARSERCLSSLGMANSFHFPSPPCTCPPDTGCMSPGFPSSLVRTNRCSRPQHHCPPMMCGQGHRPHTRSRCWLLPRLSTCPQHSLGSRLLVLHSRHTCLPRTVCTPDWMFDQPPLNVCRLRNRYTPRHPPQP